MNRWEFWIDVGGTFTDCIARSPAGQITQHKLLSSGATKGRVGEHSTQNAIADPARQNDPVNFWTGWQLALLDAEGHVIDRATIAPFDPSAGTLTVQGLKHSPAPGTHYEMRSGLEAPVIAIRYMLGIPLNQPLPPVSLRLGTTRGTNALLTRTGARTALLTTRGFGDVLEIGYQARPRLFDLTVRKPPVLTSHVVEVNERLTHDGNILQSIDVAELREQLLAARNAGIESLAISLLHADRHPAHERLIEQTAQEVGFREVSVSHRVAPLPKLVPRADTTVVDAYLNPVLRDYVARLRETLPGSDLRLLTSAGGLVSGDNFCGKDSILSGPAGGVVGFSRVAQAAGFDRAIGFDMGGTSTDVSRFYGRFELEYETQKAGVRLVAPTMAIETVAAGGGSICRFDGAKFTVGPESAGADPGPACYGRGGPLTVTDVNFFLGRIIPDRFPFPLDRSATEKRLLELVHALPLPPGEGRGEGALSRLTPDEVAAGLLNVANAKMAAAIRLVTVAKGANPADFVLVAFGGAAGQHACAIAKELGITRVLNHPQAGVLSALGIGLADITRHRSCGIERPLTGEAISFAKARLTDLQQEATQELRSEGVHADRISTTRSLDLRYRGIDSYLTIPWPQNDDFAAEFAAAHRTRYGYIHEGRPLEVFAARIEVAGHTANKLPPSHRSESHTRSAPKTVLAYFNGARREVPLFDRRDLVPGDYITGPAIITEDIATTIIEPAWHAEVMSEGELLLERAGASPPTGETKVTPTATEPLTNTNPLPLPHSAFPTSPHPAALEIFNNLVASIAEQMGVTLRNTASSVNVKERLDFSCAIFTADGRLVANAPHVPVHLGAMEETVRHTIAANPDLRPGDVIATNDPYAGGSHLPDVTVITPVFSCEANSDSPPPPRGGVRGGGEHTDSTSQNVEAQKLLFFTANRAHHAEIGGMAPGSMPPLSRNLAEEGVLIRNLKIVAEGESRFDALRELLSSGPYPSRDVHTNLADVEAQIAANRQGAEDLLALVRRFTWPFVDEYMNLVQDAAEQKVRQALARLPAGTHRFTDHLDLADGTSTPITVAITVHHGGPLAPREEFVSRSETPAATIDFTGTGPVVDGNLNANRAIVTAAIIYVLRLLVAEDIPLNHGVIRAIEIKLPTCLLNPEPAATAGASPAVAGGNVETSQRVVDVLLGAIGIAGASQGTMNNVIFGDSTFGYYETICGGSGATAEGDGASAVQVHMTNTRLTDPEILERRFPARVEEFAIRRGSGGAGQHRGGDGVTRHLHFLRPLTLSVLTQRRGNHPPYGAAGGQPGAIGQNLLIRSDGTKIELPGISQIDVEPADTLIIQTPGGGGYGHPNEKRSPTQQ